MPNSTHVALAVGAVGALSAVALSYLYTKRLRYVATVKRLTVYPVKACRGIELEEALCLPHGIASTDGLIRDRQFMLINDEGVCVTGRQHPTLVKIVTRIEEENLILEAPGGSTHCINLQDIKTLDKLVPCDVFGQKFLAIECDEATHAWFSLYLNSAVRLVYFNSDICTRQLEELEVGVHHRSNRPNAEYSQTMFPDDFPYLAVNEQSCDDLNTHLDSSSQITYRTFRPNILMSTDGPWIEDEWRYVSIGSQKFFTEKPCGRCRNVNVNPETAEVHPKAEPLNTLRKRRMLEKYKGSSPMFGVGLLIEGKPSIIKVGDTVLA